MVKIIDIMDSPDTFTLRTRLVAVWERRWSLFEPKDVSPHADIRLLRKINHPQFVPWIEGKAIVECEEAIKSGDYATSMAFIEGYLLRHEAMLPDSQEWILDRHDNLTNLINAIDFREIKNPSNAVPVEGPQLNGQRNMTVYDFDQLHRHFRHTYNRSMWDSSGVRGVFLATAAIRWYTGVRFFNLIHCQKERLEELIYTYVNAGEPVMEMGIAQPEARFHLDTKTSGITF